MRRKPALITLIACGAVLALLLVLHLTFFLFPYKPLNAFLSKPYSRVICDSEGKLLQVTTLENGERREYTEWKSLPKNVKKVFIKTEDKHFYLHNGTDYPALLNAAIQNLANKKIVRGGSTISMQLVKMISNEKQVTVSRKLNDIFYAHVLEAKLSKKRILTLYLNSLYFGHGATGVASAARTFYGCTIQELTPQQICCLAVIPRNPSLYDPLTNKTNCAQRACALYNKLFHKKMDVQEFINYLPQGVFSYPFEAPHYVRHYLSKRQKLLRSSERISINLEIQHYAEKILRDGLDQAQGSRISNASLLLIENQTGTPLAWIGNADFFDEANSGQLDGVLTKNQPGSSMKPFLYALALETKDEQGNPLYLPSSILADIPQEFGDEKLYIPSNFNNRYNGPVTLRVALASSLNVPAVSILNSVGVDNYLSKLYELGFDSLRQGGKEADLGLALGAGEVKLSELVPAFSVFIRDGKDYDGKQIYDVDTARLITSFLSDKASRALGFGYSQTFETKYPSIFKTGTSNQYQNIIALGATNNYTIGVWMGNFSGQTVVGKTGSSLPAWVAKKVLDFLEENKPGIMDFKEPENWKKTKICSLSGMIAGPDCPASRYEYVPLDYSEKENRCNWHVKKDGGVQTLYPPEYQQWARKTRPELQINYNASPLYIQTPKDNAVFYYSELHKEKQAVSVEVFGGSEDTLQVYYDDRLYSKVTRPFNFQLPVERGKHTCRVVCGDEQDLITFIIK